VTPDKLDLIFPFVVFAYGAVMTFVLHTPFFEDLARERLPVAMRQQLQKHRGFGVFCLLAGGLWSLQNLWLS
jgi:hypothetical protein